MSEGCGACACGVPGACDQLYLPSFLWPGIISLLVVFGVVVFLYRKRPITFPFKVLIVGWVILVMIFAGTVYLKTETAGDRAGQAAERCQISDDPTCEY